MELRQVNTSRWIQSFVLYQNSHLQKVILGSTLGKLLWLWKCYSGFRKRISAGWGHNFWAQIRKASYLNVDIIITDNFTGCILLSLFICFDVFNLILSGKIVEL